MRKPGIYLGNVPCVVEKTAAEWAMDYMFAYGQIDGSHHKAWVLDQIARILKGTPVITEMAKWEASTDYPDGLEELRFHTGEPSQDYKDWVQELRGDEVDGEYDYDEGIAP